VPDACNAKYLADVLCDGNCQPVSVSRAGRAMLPSPSLPLRTGDVIHISATEEGVAGLRKRVKEIEEACDVCDDSLPA